jgi:organic radical activating enzyme
MSKGPVTELRVLLTARCNFDCYFCLNEYFGNKNQLGDLTPSEYQFLAREAAHLGITDITLTGGEPSLRRDLADISALLAEVGARVTIVTNGYALNRHYEALCSTSELHVSFHSFNDDDWARITRSQGARSKVQANIVGARERFPGLRIKLNVVSEAGNSAPCEIEKYLEFARRWNLELSIFQEGLSAFRIALAKSDRELSGTPKWWDLSLFSPELLWNSGNKLVYSVAGVVVALSFTSTDIQTWRSIWLSPSGGAYVDNFQSTPIIDMSAPVKARDGDMSKRCLNSLVREARLRLKLMRPRSDSDRRRQTVSMGRLIQDRILTLPIGKQVPASLLLSQ